MWNISDELHNLLWGAKRSERAEGTDQLQHEADPPLQLINNSVKKHFYAQVKVFLPHWLKKTNPTSTEELVKQHPGFSFCSSARIFQKMMMMMMVVVMVKLRLHRRTEQTDGHRDTQQTSMWLRRHRPAGSSEANDGAGRVWLAGRGTRPLACWVRRRERERVKVTHGKGLWVTLWCQNTRTSIHVLLRHLTFFIYLHRNRSPDNKGRNQLFCLSIHNAFKLCWNICQLYFIWWNIYGAHAS